MLTLALPDVRTGDATGHEAENDHLLRCAAVLASLDRPADTPARISDHQFPVLVVECDEHTLTGVRSQLHERLKAAGVAASIGAATRRVDETLLERGVGPTKPCVTTRPTRRRRPTQCSNATH